MSYNFYNSAKRKNYNYQENGLEFKIRYRTNLILKKDFNKQFFNDVKINLKQNSLFQIFLVLLFMY